MRTPLVRGVRLAGLSASAREKARGNVVSGLVVSASDDEEDFFSSTPSTRSKASQGSLLDTPVLARVRETNRSEICEGVVDVGRDTGRCCGDVGYRCSKAFCFKCVS